MADLSYSVDQIQQLLRCPVCLDRYREPKLLPCQHTFCLRPCLEGLVDHSARSIRCPECRAEHRLPGRGGVAGLPNNLTIISFLDLPTPSSPQTDSNARADPPTSGEALDENFGPDNSSASSLRCSVCSESASVSFCPHCQRQICSTCKRSHAQQSKQDVGRLINQIRRGLPRLSESITSSEQRAQRLQQKCDAVSLQIQDTIDRLVKTLKDRQLMLQSELNTFLLGEKRTLRLCQETVEVEVATAASFCDSTEAILQRVDEDVPLENLVSLRRQCSEHLENIRNHDLRIDSREPMLAREPRFYSNLPPNITNSLSSLGELVVSNAENLSSRASHNGNPGTTPRASAFTASSVQHTAGMPSHDTQLMSSAETAWDLLEDYRNSRQTLSERELPSQLDRIRFSQIPRRSRGSSNARNNSDRMAGFLGMAQPNSSSERRHLSTTVSPGARQRWIRNINFHPVEAPVHETSDGAADNSLINSSTPRSEVDNTQNVTNHEAQVESVSEDSTDVLTTAQQPATLTSRPIRVPAAVRFDIAMDETIGDLSDELENTIAFRYSTGNSTSVSTPRNNYQQKGRSILRFGGRGNGDNQFTWPRGVAIHSPNNSILVADSSNHRIQVFDDCGRFQRSVGSYGQSEGELDCLAGITTDDSGRIITCDRYNNRVQVFSSDGQFVSMFGEEGQSDGQFNYPWGVACDSQNNIYVCDKDNHRIQVFRSDGTFLRKFGHLGNRPGMFDGPNYVAVSRGDNQVYVTDTGNHRIQVFTCLGEFLFTFGVQGTQRGQLKFPKGIAVDDQGFVIVADSGNSRIVVFRQDGRFYCMFGSWGTENGRFKGPEGVAIMQNGNLVVSDKENHRVQVF